MAATAATVYTDLAPLRSPPVPRRDRGTPSSGSVSQVANAMQTALFVSWADRPDLLAGLEERALRLRLSLPHDLAGLYLQQGRGVDAVQATIREASVSSGTGAIVPGWEPSG